MNDKKETRRDGFRIGNYFVSFPDGNFIEEDEKGNMYVLADIYRIDDNKNAIKLEKNEITPEVEQLISEEINRLLMDAVKVLDK